MIPQIPMCAFDGAQWLLFGPNVPSLIYYSHIPNIIIALALALFVLLSDRKQLANRILFFTILAFETWVFFALMFWATNRGDVVMFSWLMDILVEPLVYIGALYLVYVLIDKKDISFLKKLVLGLLYAPVAILLPTALTLSDFDITTCLATEGPVALYYTYFVEILVSVWLLGVCIRRFIGAKTKSARGEILLLSIGTILFLGAFSWGNITGSFTDDWQLGDYGLFGMPVFLGFLVYSIVRFRTFNLKVAGAFALVFSLCALMFSLLFVKEIVTFRIIVAISFIISVIFGIQLIRSVKKEIEQREHIELLARDLQTANDRQVTLIHFITHQIKGFVTKSRNIFATLLEGDYGPVPDTMKPMFEEGFRSGTQGANTIQEILNASNIKSGKVSYVMAPFDLKGMIEEIIQALKDAAEKKGLALNLNLGESLTVNGDRAQLVNAYKNLIDNSIKYTLKGSVTVSLEKKDGKALFTITDTGVGITDEDKKNLFTEGGHGKESSKVNVDSTGFGLYIVKNIVDAHKGRVWAESDGPGKGSRFYIELTA